MNLKNKPTSFEEACYQVGFDIQRLVIDKQKDYGQENILAFGERGLVVRLWDKVSRLKNLVWNCKSAKNESITDTYRDIAGYAILAIMLERGWFTLPIKEK